MSNSTKLTWEKVKAEGGKVGFTASTFDLCHSGHIAMLQEAKANCDWLVVGLLSDPTNDRPEKNKPIQSMFERWMQLQAVTYVDEIIPFESEQDLEDMLLVIMPTVRFCGEEYRDVDHTGKHIEGIEIIYNKRKHSFSSSELRERVKERELARLGLLTPDVKDCEVKEPMADKMEEW